MPVSGETYEASIGSISTSGGTYLNPFYDASANRTRYHDYVGSTFSEDGYNNVTNANNLGASSSELYHPLIIHTGTKANQNLRLTINDMHTKAMGLDSTKLVPRDAAIAALSRLDKAVDYALNESTHMGAYSSRLDLTVSNLTTSNENTQASESTIRDADMAKEMTSLVKANVLTQASQAMLAQAHQNLGSVLSLLQ